MTPEEMQAVAGASKKQPAGVAASD
jgi:hypothetical protein